MNRRIVFDTSTLVSAALRAESIPRQSFKLGLIFKVCGSYDTLAELERVLPLRKLDRYIDRASREAFLGFLRSQVHWVTVTEAQMRAIDPSCRDPNDNIFLALALAAEAFAIVTGDTDLLVLHPWNGIAILTPAQFLETYGRSL